jgi:hypothetical protein
MNPPTTNHRKLKQTENDMEQIPLKGTDYSLLRYEDNLEWGMMKMLMDGLTGRTTGTVTEDGLWWGSDKGLGHLAFGCHTGEERILFLEKHGGNIVVHNPRTRTLVGFEVLAVVKEPTP